MMTHRNLGIFSSPMKLGIGALLALSLGCATAGPKSPETGALPDEEDEAPGKKAASSATAGGPVEVPLISRKPGERKITEEQKADYDKAVSDYIRARKAGSVPGQECGSIS